MHILSITTGLATALLHAAFVSLCLWNPSVPVIYVLSFMISLSQHIIVTTVAPTYRQTAVDDLTDPVTGYLPVTFMTIAQYLYLQSTEHIALIATIAFLICKVYLVVDRVEKYVEKNGYNVVPQDEPCEDEVSEESKENASERDFTLEDNVRYNICLVGESTEGAMLTIKTISFWTNDKKVALIRSGDYQAQGWGELQTYQPDNATIERLLDDDTVDSIILVEPFGEEFKQIAHNVLDLIYNSRHYKKRVWVITTQPLSTLRPEVRANIDYYLIFDQGELSEKELQAVTAMVKDVDKFADMYQKIRGTKNRVLVNTRDGTTSYSYALERL